MLRGFICLLTILAAAPLTRAAQPTLRPAQGYHLHLPGIGGKLRIDHRLVQGLKEGDFASQVEIYDWTTADPGLGSLFALQRNQDEAKKVASMIEQHAKAHERITLSAHSGGNAIAIWALEKLPPDVRIDTLLMMAPALSPTYDLTKSLAHANAAYSFNSEHDPVLGIGCQTFGTMDGVRTDAAGRVGFTHTYINLTQFPYQQEWTEYDNIGDHIGPMTRAFARQILAPLLINGTKPVIHTVPTTSRADRFVINNGTSTTAPTAR